MMKHQNIDYIAIPPFRVPISVFVFLACVVVISIYLFLPNHRETIVVSAAIFGGAGALWSAWYAGKAIVFNTERDQVRRALEMSGRLTGGQLTDARYMILNMVESPGIPTENLHKFITDNSDLLKAVRCVLNLLEDISISIQKYDADEDTAYMTLAWLLPHLYNVLLPFIDKERERCKSPLLYTEVERLAKKWATQEYLVTRTPVKKF